MTVAASKLGPASQERRYTWYVQVAPLLELKGSCDSRPELAVKTARAPCPRVLHEANLLLLGVVAAVIAILVCLHESRGDVGRPACLLEPGPQRVHDRGKGWLRAW